MVPELAQIKFENADIAFVAVIVWCLEKLLAIIKKSSTESSVMPKELVYPSKRCTTRPT